jgi:hypothetical protein
LTGYENLLAFPNPDETVVILMQNDLGQELPIRIKVGEKVTRRPKAARRPQDPLSVRICDAGMRNAG